MKNKLESFVKKRKKSLIWLAGFLVVFLYFFTAWGITITVLDAETKKPVEGASCIAWWQLGEIGGSHYTAKIVEAKTDSRGKFRVPFVVGLKATSVPNIRIYKPNYVGWHSEYIYLGHMEKDFSIPIEKDRDFKMKSQDVYLGKFKDEYSRYSHEKFLSNYLPGGKEASKFGIINLQFSQAIEGEIPLVRKERASFEKQQKRGRESQKY